MLTALWIQVVVALSVVGMPSEPSEREAKHRFHVSYGRMAVEGGVAVCQVRFFKHDLEDAMKKFFDDSDLKVDVNPRSDSLYTVYFNEFFVMEQEGEVLKGSIASSGEEGDMWWYLMQYQAEEPIEQFKVTNTLLFEMFDDQRNVLKISHFPSEKNLSYYFVEGSDTYDVEF